MGDSLVIGVGPHNIDYPPIYGSNHLGLRCSAPPEHQMILIISGSVPSSRARAVPAGPLRQGALADPEPEGSHRASILLHLPLPAVGVSIVMERGRQQNDSLADG